MTVFLTMLAVAAPAPVLTPPNEHRRARCRGACKQRVKRRMIRERRRDVVRPFQPWLDRLGLCESTNNYRAMDPSGTYTGKYQFDDQTWESVGGTGRAMHAGPLEQDYRTVQLRKRRGTGPWPVCG